MGSRSADTAVKVGARLGRYRVTAELGAGGMGAVYLAEDSRLGRSVALKVLPTELALEEERLQRFEREARAVAALNHPNIVTLYSVEEESPAGSSADEPVHFLTMEWVDGQTLDRVCGEAGTALAQFFELAVQLVDAVAAAHRAGIVHRDLKPANVMVSGEGRLKVLDFGIAKLEDRQPAEEAVTALTHKGMVMGTFQYMAPEQALGKDVGPAADVFALGILMYEMLAGRSPFRGTSAPEVVSAILRDAPAPLAGIRADVPDDLAALVERCLEKSLDRRYRSASEVGATLRTARKAYQRSVLLSEAPTYEGVAGDSMPTLAVEAAPAPAAPHPAVAVLGFQNLLGDQSADWLSTGITETVTVDLKKLAGLRVVSRDNLLRELGPAGFAERAGPAEPDESQLFAAGARLGIDWIVSGAFQKIGETIRITARFVDVAAGELIDSVKLDGTMSEIFVLQDRIVRELAKTLALEAAEPVPASPAGNDELAAYECYARGVELVARMDSASLEEGRGFFERAIDLDPRYALAHSGLGHLHSMRFIGTTDPADLEVSVRHLRRATELDPELGEPWAWLGYDYLRLERSEDAVAAGRRAVTLEPDNPFARYILGVAHFFATKTSGEPERIAKSVEHLRATTLLAPRYQPAWQILGAIYLSNGCYDSARQPIERAAEIEAGGDWELAQFVGAHTLLGRLLYRRGDLEASRAAYQKSLELLQDNRHFYQPMATAAALCGLGDLGAAGDQPDRALTHYRQAREYAEAHDRALGVGWLVVRARLGMAAMFRHFRMRREEGAALAAALELLGSRDGFDFSALWADGPADLYYDLAVLQTRRGDRELAVEALDRSLEHGWGDLTWLEQDERLAPVVEDPRLEALLDNLRTRALAVSELGVESSAGP